MIAPKLRILSNSKLDAKDELEEKLESAFNKIQSLTAGLTEREMNEILNNQVAKGISEYEEVQLAKLYNILVYRDSAQVALRDIIYVNRDKFNVVISRVSQLICDKWKKLQDHARFQIVWLVSELVRSNIHSADVLCHHLVRQIAGGDISLDNLWLSESLLDLFVDQKSWLEKFPNLLATVLFAFLRIIADHLDIRFTDRQRKEVRFCVTLLREKFDDCMVIGRDLVRLLQNVACIPEFEALWYDIINQPSKLSANFTGIEQLLNTRTSRQFLASRITPDMERKLIFLTSQVKFGHQKRYENWFQSQYLTTAEGQSLRSDLVRYICACIHPSNEVLSSNTLPRWALIGWLLTTCTSNVASANTKLALFYDWLFFNPKKDNIMNIEPAILLIHHSLNQLPAMTATLLDFLCRIINNFYPLMTDDIQQGVENAFKAIIEKGVLSSLAPVLQNRKLDKELRDKLKQQFPQFLDKPDDSPSSTIVSTMPKLDHHDKSHFIDARTQSADEQFSDGEEDEATSPTLKDELLNGTVDFVLPQKAKAVEISPFLSQLDERYRLSCNQLKDEAEVELKCELVEQIVISIMDDENFDTEKAKILATCLGELLRTSLEKQLFPDQITEESIEESTGTPLFVVFRYLTSIVDAASRLPLLLFVFELYKRHPQIGYFLLYFLKVTQHSDRKMEIYCQFCAHFEDKTIRDCLRIDLQLCADDDARLFAFLLPDVFTEFPEITCANVHLVHIVVSSIDSTQLQELICQILQGHLVLFKKEAMDSILSNSLKWESIEQYFLWQLIFAHQIPVENLLCILPKLKFGVHPEALSSILLCLKHENPSSEMLRCILSRESNENDTFVISILRWWADKQRDRLADLLYSLISRGQFDETPLANKVLKVVSVYKN